MNQSICTVDGCPVPIGEKGARGWCPKHYQRWLATGDALGRKCLMCGRYLFEVFGAEVKRRRYCSPDCLPQCSVDECSSPARKNEWCAAHYSQWRRVGHVSPFQHKWAERGHPCDVCGQPCQQYGFRSVCSRACRTIKHRFPDRPKQIACASCEAIISLVERDTNGRLRTLQTLLCSECRRRYRRPLLSAGDLAERDGAVCSLCGTDVDMSIRWPHRLSASVDHVRPLSRGGTEDESNLALAHLTCNTSKQARLTQ